MQLFVAQFLSGLASASSLFLVASGLSLIFGVTRIVNFAHGAFFMLGAYVAYTLVEGFAATIGYWGGILAAAVLIGLVGAGFEIVLLRRIYRSPELFQLLATFGATLCVEDIVLLIWGPEDLLGPRAPGFKGAVQIFGKLIPSYDLLLIALGPVVLGVLWLVMHRTKWGVLVRAATQDREMVAALGVNQKWLFTGVFAVGSFLAALGGALQIPREAVDHAMDIRIIVEVFVVVVIGGLGSIPGAFLASVLVAEFNAFGILILPKISLVLVFLVMAVVLIVRPYGLLGKPEAAPRPSVGDVIVPWHPFGREGRLIMAAILGFACLLPLLVGHYGLAIATEALIFSLFAASLHLLMSVGGLVSFGHAAFFGLGAYGAALSFKLLGWPMVPALLAGPVLAALAGAIVGWLALSLSGVYFAMLTLAFAQILWSIVFQWVSVTGGDNGVLGVWPAAWVAEPAAYYWLTLLIVASLLALLRSLIFSPFGFALRATRDSQFRAEAVGIDRRLVQWRAFVFAAFAAGAAGALFACFKGSVFPDSLSISTSVDGLVMVLLGGVGTTLGPIVGAFAFKLLSFWLISHTDYSKLALGSIIIGTVLLLPHGLAAGLPRLPRFFLPRETIP